MTSSIFRNEDHKTFQSGARKMGKWAAVPRRSLLSGFLERFSGSSRDMSRGCRTLGVSGTGSDLAVFISSLVCIFLPL